MPWIVRKSFVVDRNGATVIFQRGDVIADGDPLVTSHADVLVFQAAAGGGATQLVALARKFKGDGDQALGTYQAAAVTLSSGDFTRAGTAFQSIPNGIKVLKTGLYGLELCARWQSGSSGAGGINFMLGGAIFGGGFIIERTGVARPNRNITVALNANTDLSLQTYIESAGTLTGTDSFGTSLSLTYFGPFA